MTYIFSHKRGVFPFAFFCRRAVVRLRLRAKKQNKKTSKSALFALVARRTRRELGTCQ